jgi:hypothetical protein
MMLLCGFVSHVHAQYGGTAGAFARIGFGARGLAMGNAMTAVVNGELAPYYNPALTAFQSDHAFTAAYTAMSLDRSLNFVQYIQHLKKYAGISVGIINSGVSKIDGRDANAIPTGGISTSENMFFASFANRFSDWLTFGVTFKYYHYKLYEDITAYTVGVDLGCIVIIDKDMSIGASVGDIGAKYQWNTTKLYDDRGLTTEDVFPTIIKIGIARTFFDSSVTAAIDYVASTENTHQLCAGIEWSPMDIFSLRAGCDRMDIRDRWSGAMPTFGFAIEYPMGSWHPTIDYTYGIEPFAPSGIHIISVTVGF